VIFITMYDSDIYRLLPLPEPFMLLHEWMQSETWLFHSWGAAYPVDHHCHVRTHRRRWWWGFRECKITQSSCCCTFTPHGCEHQPTQ
jgi:hypothetical protein